MNCLLGEELARKLVIENTNALAEIFEPVEVVKGDLYTPFIDKAEETVAELTYKKAFEIYGNPLPDIVDLRIERINIHTGEWICCDLSGIADAGATF